MALNITGIREKPSMGHNKGPSMEKSETKLTISVGGEKVETSLEQMEAATARLQGKKPKKQAPKDVSGISGNRLKSFIERVERLEEERKALGEDIRDVYAEAKGTGFEPKIMRKVVAKRKQNAEKAREEKDLFDLYCNAIGMEV